MWYHNILSISVSNCYHVSPVPTPKLFEIQFFNRRTNFLLTFATYETKKNNNKKILKTIT
jgi:hypothetical protein